MTEQNTLEVLMKARALIAKPGGWCQGYAADGRGGYCARGAIEAAQGTLLDLKGMPIVGCMSSPAVGAIRAQTPPNGEGKRIISSFNDEWGRTKDEVLALYDRAIEAEWEKVQGASEPILREPVAA